MSAPTLRADGSCPDCANGWQCAYHQAEGVRRFNEREKMFRRVALGIRQNRIMQVCAENELESDEFYTREQKALAIIEQNRS